MEQVQPDALRVCLFFRFVALAQITDYLIVRTILRRRSCKGTRYASLKTVQVKSCSQRFSSTYSIPISSTSQKRRRTRSSKNLETTRPLFYSSVPDRRTKTSRSESSTGNGSSRINGKLTPHRLNIEMYSHNIVLQGIPQQLRPRLSVAVVQFQA